MQFRKASCEGQAKSGSFLLPCWASVQLLELSEEATQVFGSNPNARVTDGDLRPRIDLAPSDLNASSIGSELDGVGEQVQQHLLQLGRVSYQVQFRPWVNVQRYRLALSQRFNGCPGFVDQPSEIPSKNAGSPAASRIGIFFVCSIRAPLLLVWIVSSGISTRVPFRSVSLSPETKCSACSAGKKSKSFLPISSSRGNPSSSSPARFKRMNRRSLASFTKIMLGMFSIIESKNLLAALNSVVRSVILISSSLAVIAWSRINCAVVIARAARVARLSKSLISSSPRGAVPSMRLRLSPPTTLSRATIGIIAASRIRHF